MLANSLQYKQKLALVREQNIDITHFEEDLDAFKVAFAKNYQSAWPTLARPSKRLKAIRRMEEIKKFLTTSENQLRLANNKLDDVPLSKNWHAKNPTMKAKFEALKRNEEKDWTTGGYNQPNLLRLIEL